MGVPIPAVASSSSEQRAVQLMLRGATSTSTTSPDRATAAASAAAQQPAQPAYAPQNHPSVLGSLLSVRVRRRGDMADSLDGDSAETEYLTSSWRRRNSWRRAQEALAEAESSSAAAGPSAYFQQPRSFSYHDLPPFAYWSTLSAATAPSFLLSSVSNELSPTSQFPLPQPSSESGLQSIAASYPTFRPRFGRSIRDRTENTGSNSNAINAGAATDTTDSANNSTRVSPVRTTLSARLSAASNATGEITGSSRSSRPNLPHDATAIEDSVDMLIQETREWRERLAQLLQRDNLLGDRLSYVPPAFRRVSGTGSRSNTVDSPTAGTSADPNTTRDESRDGEVRSPLTATATPARAFTVIGRGGAPLSIPLTAARLNAQTPSSQNQAMTGENTNTDTSADAPTNSSNQAPSTNASAATNPSSGNSGANSSLMVFRHVDRFNRRSGVEPSSSSPSTSSPTGATERAGRRSLSISFSPSSSSDRPHGLSDRFHRLQRLQNLNQPSSSSSSQSSALSSSRTLYAPPVPCLRTAHGRRRHGARRSASVDDLPALIVQSLADGSSELVNRYNGASAEAGPLSESISASLAQVPAAAPSDQPQTSSEHEQTALEKPTVLERQEQQQQQQEEKPKEQPPIQQSSRTPTIWAIISEAASLAATESLETTNGASTASMPPPPPPQATSTTPTSAVNIVSPSLNASRRSMGFSPGFGPIRSARSPSISPRLPPSLSLLPPPLNIGDATRSSSNLSFGGATQEGIPTTLTFASLRTAVPRSLPLPDESKRDGDEQKRE